jgi:flagellar protein FliO/FliZ
MDYYMLLKACAAFAFVLGLMWLFSLALKKVGLAGQSMLPGVKKRLKVVEYLPIDHKRKLVIVRRDDKEHLLVLGPNSELVVESNIPAKDTPVLEIVPATNKEQKIV